MPLPIPWRDRPLRLFALSLGILVCGLIAFLFGVRLEAVVPGNGTVTSLDARDLRAPEAGLIELTCRPGDEVAGDAVLVQMPAAAVRAPAGSRWLVAEVAVAHGQAVSAGDLLVRLVPVDAAGRLARPAVRLALEEKHFGQVEVGQSVRLTSLLYPPRLHGQARGTVLRLEPVPTVRDGVRQYQAWVTIDEAPFPLRPGSGMKAEVVVGQQATYRIILEH